MKKVSFFLCGMILAVFSNLSLAHHSSISTFTPDRSSSVEGIITEFRFLNPHVLIFLDVQNQDENITQWIAEASSATSFRRSGWKASTLTKGDLIRVNGDATIDGSPMVWVNQIEFLDKQSRRVLAVLDDKTNPEIAFSNQFEAVSENSLAEPYFIPLTLPTGEPNFTGVTAESNNPEYDDGPPDGNDPPLPYNEIGKEAFAAWKLENDPQVFCDPPGLVRQGGYTPYGQKVTQYPDHIVIEYEEYGSKRAIFLDDELPSPGIRTHLGDSVARYEGDTLVIETINLAANASGHRGRPLSDQARVIEVFSRVDDPKYGSHLRITTTVHDPKFLTEAWTISRTKAYQEEYQFLRNQCVSPLRERPSNVWQEPT